MQPFPEPSSLSSSPLPTNSFHYDGLHELLFAAHILPFSSTCDTPLLTPVVPNDVQLPPARTITTRKRTVRKDRHSKIYTAQGPRDRRMRLSLEVARRFFDLQDMLGFDKPSKTVQWLLNKSKSAIRDVAAAVNPGGGFTFSTGSSSSSSQSSTSECEDKFTATTMTNEVNVKPQKIKRSVAQQTKKTMINPVLAKEFRAKARTRARERTREKKRLMLGTSASTIEESGSHDLKSSLDQLVADADEPIQNFDYHQNIITCNDMVSSFPDHWELQQFSGIYW